MFQSEVVYIDVKFRNQQSFQPLFIYSKNLEAYTYREMSLSEITQDEKIHKVVKELEFSIESLKEHIFYFVSGKGKTFYSLQMFGEGEIYFESFSDLRDALEKLIQYKEVAYDKK